MAAIKSAVSIFTAQALAGDSGVTTSGWLNLDTRYGGIVQGKVTNGGTTLGKGAVIQAQISPNQAAGAEADFECRRVMGKDASEVTTFEIRIPPEVQNLRLKVNRGDAAATIDAIFSRLDEV